MAFPVGEGCSRPGAAHCGTEREPDPITSAEAANRAEDNARRAVEGVVITPHHK